MRLSSAVALCVFICSALTSKPFELRMVAHDPELDNVLITKHKEYNELYAGNSTAVDPLGDIVRFTVNDDGTLQNEAGVKVSVLSSDDFPAFGLSLDKDKYPAYGFSIRDEILYYKDTKAFSSCPFFVRNKYENYLSTDLNCPAGTTIALGVVKCYSSTTSTTTPTLLPTSVN